MLDADGVGLAAPQVGVPIQLAVVDVAHAPELQTYFRVDGADASLAGFMPLVFVNPRIETARRKSVYVEGCLSFPGVRYEISRPDALRAHLTLLDGRQVLIETDGLLSRALQHESDHLHGRLFIDRLSAADRLGLKKRLSKCSLNSKKKTPRRRNRSPATRERASGDSSRCRGYCRVIRTRRKIGFGEREGGREDYGLGEAVGIVDGRVFDSLAAAAPNDEVIGHIDEITERSGILEASELHSG